MLHRTFLDGLTPDTSPTNAPPHHPRAFTPPPPAPPSLPSSLPFVLIVPGHSPITQFQQLSATQFSTILPAPHAIADVVLYLNPAVPFPSTHGVVLYSAPGGGEGWKLLGAVTAQSPSAILRTGWATDEMMVGSSTANLGIGIEEVGTIQNLGETFRPVEDRQYIAKKIAKDLYNFMASFAGGGGGQLVVPSNAFDMWIKRFDDKFRRDPNFFLKTQD